MQHIFCTFAMLKATTRKGAYNNTKMQRQVSDMHIAHGRRGEQINATQTYHRRGPEEEACSCWMIFGNFLEKTAFLMSFGLHFTRFQRQLKEQNFRDLQAN